MRKSSKNTMISATAVTMAFLAFVTVAPPVSGQKSVQSARASARIAVASAQNAAAAILGLSASPSLISFNASAPGSAVPGSTSATISFTISAATCTGICPQAAWSLSAGTTSSVFPGCVTVPVSAVTLRCSSASATGAATASCSTGNFSQLPASLPGLPVAAGTEPLSQTATYSVTLNYQLTDSWQYIPNTCPLNVTYTLNAQ